MGLFAACEWSHSKGARDSLQYAKERPWRRPIKKDQAFTECVVLSKETFDPDAVFLDDIVDDKVLPRLSLAVEGLTGTTVRARRQLELKPEDTANEPMPASTTMPDVALDPEQLEVYGWETSFWRKFRGYLGF